MSAAVIARAMSPRGEIVLRRRPWDGELELRVNGVFAMDTRESTTERALATLGLDEVVQSRDALDAAALTVLVGGLGLGFTLRQLAASPLVARLVVAEIEPALVAWHRAGLVPRGAEILDDPRVTVVVADVRDVLADQPPRSLDLMVLDVDNGPGFLVYDANAALYRDEFLAECRGRLAPAGRLVVWSGHPAPDLHNALERVFGSAASHATAVSLGSRADHYYVYVAPARQEEAPAWSAR